MIILFVFHSQSNRSVNFFGRGGLKVNNTAFQNMYSYFCPIYQLNSFYRKSCPLYINKCSFVTLNFLFVFLSVWLAVCLLICRYSCLSIIYFTPMDILLLCLHWSSLSRKDPDPHLWPGKQTMNYSQLQIQLKYLEGKCKKKPRIWNENKYNLTSISSLN